jgi:hypothetical protein
MLSPVLEKTTLDTQYSNGKEVDLMTIDTDEEGALAQKYQASYFSMSNVSIDGRPNYNSFDCI